MPVAKTSPLTFPSVTAATDYHSSSLPAFPSDPSAAFFPPVPAATAFSSDLSAASFSPVPTGFPSIPAETTFSPIPATGSAATAAVSLLNEKGISSVSYLQKRKPSKQKFSPPTSQKSHEFSSNFQLKKAGRESTKKELKSEGKNKKKLVADYKKELIHKIIPKKKLKIIKKSGHNEEKALSKNDQVINILDNKPRSKEKHPSKVDKFVVRHNKENFSEIGKADYCNKREKKEVIIDLCSDEEKEEIVVDICSDERKTEKVKLAKSEAGNVSAKPLKENELLDPEKQIVTP